MISTQICGSTGAFSKEKSGQAGLAKDHLHNLQFAINGPRAEVVEHLIAGIGDACFRDAGKFPISDRPKYWK